jgi:hypothetical protein
MRHTATGVVNNTHYSLIVKTKCHIDLARINTLLYFTFLLLQVQNIGRHSIDSPASFSASNNNLHPKEQYIFKNDTSM